MGAVWWKCVRDETQKQQVNMEIQRRPQGLARDFSQLASKFAPTPTQALAPGRTGRGGKAGINTRAQKLDVFLPQEDAEKAKRATNLNSYLPKSYFSSQGQQSDKVARAKQRALQHIAMVDPDQAFAVMQSDASKGMYAGHKHDTMQRRRQKGLDMKRRVQLEGMDRPVQRASANAHRTLAATAVHDSRMGGARPTQRAMEVNAMPTRYAPSHKMQNTQGTGLSMRFLS